MFVVVFGFTSSPSIPLICVAAVVAPTMAIAVAATAAAAAAAAADPVPPAVLTFCNRPLLM